MTVFNDTLTQGMGIAVAAAQQGIYHVVASADLGVTYGLLDVRARPATASDAVGVASTITPSRGQIIVEQLRIAHSQVTNQKAHLAVSDVIDVAHQTPVARPITLSNGIGIAPVQQVQMVLRIIEDLGIAPAFMATLHYHNTIHDTVGIAEAFARFVGGEINDQINIQSVMGGSAHKPGLLSEGIGVAAALAPQMMLRMIVSDSLALDDASILNAIYTGTIAEGIELSAAYLSPGDSITTWAMNTRNGAVTEYSNFEFNSFTQIGNRYVAASSSGLYELLGDDDDGTDIIAHIKSGFAQWAGSKFTMFKGIYLGLRGEGDFVLKLITGDDKTYLYTVNVQSQKTTKVTTGKGLRARYWAFELISTGQDFDLDTIEFVPLVADRRV